MIFISSFNPFMTEADIIQKPVQNQWTGFYMISASVMKGLKQCIKFPQQNIN